MPVPMLKGMAKKAHKSKGDAERYWNEAKQSARKEGIPAGTPRFYRYVTGIVKRRMGGPYAAHATTMELAKKVNKWSGAVTKSVKKGQHTKQGIFTQPARKIAKYLHSKAGAGRAIKKLTFYINRAGKHLSVGDRNKLERAKRMLQRKHMQTAMLMEIARAKDVRIKHPRRTPSEMKDHIEHTKRFNAIPFNEDQHREHSNVDDTEFTPPPGHFLESNPDTDPMWGISYTSSLEDDVDEAWEHDQEELDEHHHAREAVGHHADMIEAYEKAKMHAMLAKHSQDPEDQLYHKQISKRYAQQALMQAQKYQNHVRESRQC